MTDLASIRTQLEALLDHVFHGQEPTYIAVAAGFFAFVWLMVFVVARHRWFRVFAFILMLIGIGLLVITVAVMTSTITCRFAMGTVRYQFADEEAQQASIKLTQCHSRRIGEPEFGPWDAPYPERNYLHQR